MPPPDYKTFIEKFSVADIEEQLLGDRTSGFSICSEICERYADSSRIALRHESMDGTVSEHSFADLNRRAGQFANYLDSCGIGRGDRVACLLPRTPELFVVVLGTLRAGAVYQPLFTAFGPGAIEYRIEKAQTRLIVTDETNRPKLGEVNDCPPVLLVTDGATGHDDAVFDDALNGQSPDFEPVVIGAKDPFLQMFTSGTVGKSKGVSVPAEALLSMFIYMKYGIGLEPEDVYWNVADPGWAYGLYYAVVGPLLLGHTTHINEAGFTAANTLEFLSKHGITNLAAAPTAYRMLMANEALLDVAGDIQLRLASSAGEPLNPEVVHWINRKLGCPVGDHYGQTEIGMTVCSHHGLEHPRRIGSMGYAMPGYRVAALKDDFTEAGAGETGQLAVDMEASELYYFQGYTWGEKEPFHGKYYLTGDVVEAHGDGAFTFAGRDDDIISSAGYRIGPADVESTLIEHASVAESGVVGKPHAERGAIVKAYVVLNSGFEANDALADELQQHVRNRLSTHAFPREIEFVTELPKTPSGKIQRFMLRQRAEAE
ncbi:MAG: AMP-binding protein [Gammaproteobacteria bacterium]